MIKGFIKGFLGIDELKIQVDAIDQRVEAIDQRVTTVEIQAETMLRHFGNYKNRTSEELKLMDGQIGDLLISVEALVDRIQYGKGADQAKKLKKRLKLNKALIIKTLKAQGG